MRILRAIDLSATPPAQAEALEAGLTVLETLERAAPDAEMKDIKALLGRMMFSGKAMHKKAGRRPYSIVVMLPARKSHTELPSIKHFRAAESCQLVCATGLASLLRHAGLLAPHVKSPTVSQWACRSRC